jgi:hypothetical protein
MQMNVRSSSHPVCSSFFYAPQAREGTVAKAGDVWETTTGATQQAGAYIAETAQKAVAAVQQLGKEGSDRTGEEAEAVKQYASETAQQAKERAGAAKDTTVETARQTGDVAAEKAQATKEGAGASLEGEKGTTEGAVSVTLRGCVVACIWMCEK